MKKQIKVLLVAVAVLLAIAFALWTHRKSLSVSEPPASLPAVSSSTSQVPPSGAPSQPPSTQGAAIGHQRHFVNMGVLEANAILDEIMKRDYASIMQSWLDAGRIEHDLPKQDAIASQLGGVLRNRPPSPEFLRQMRDFIVDNSNSKLERGMLLGALTFAATKQTEETLIEIATTASDDVTRSAMGSISTLGTNFGGANQEELAPALEQLWRDSHYQTMRLSVAKAMAQVGAPSSIELLLTAALAPNGQDDERKKEALYALESANILNENAVPPLAARLSNEAPESEASKLASSTLARMTVRPAANALVAWLQTADGSAATLAQEYATNTQFPEIWQTALNSAIPFNNEQNRDAIRVGLLAYHSGRRTNL